MNTEDLVRCPALPNLKWLLWCIVPAGINGVMKLCFRPRENISVVCHSITPPVLMPLLLFYKEPSDQRIYSRGLNLNVSHLKISDCRDASAESYRR
ncbi:hypothetical protein RRG08_020808 [Elysia crispata]|uniref:Uncharacterized protein n=1 Tax=Elysia crispata TaxID=231223 RepID=A0AAE0YSL7_9GAST|nr:hypothetical protein RRG08_020808 [Elysia crispata]